MENIMSLRHPLTFQALATSSFPAHTPWTHYFLVRLYYVLLIYVCAVLIAFISLVVM